MLTDQAGSSTQKRHEHGWPPRRREPAVWTAPHNFQRTGRQTDLGADALGPVSSWWWKPLKELKLATFNARAETFATKPMFRSAFKRNRCLIPVSGYYEWQDTPGGKQLWYFTARDGSRALTIAGLWDEWQDMEANKSLKSSTMIITESNKFVAEVHDRMPVLLAEKDYAQWLSGKAGLELLKPAAENVLEKWRGFRAGQRMTARR